MARITKVGRTSRGTVSQFAEDVHAGLSATPKTLSSVYFYDDTGSELFRRIMELPEYYLTRAETEILERSGAHIARTFAGSACDVVDLGAGDGTKTAILLERLRDQTSDLRYLPVDVCEPALHHALDALGSRLPWLASEGIEGDYREAIAWLATRDGSRQRLVLLLGSNVGNLDDETARALFHDLRAFLKPGDHLLVGFDLLKDPAMLTRAYDDAAGVTREFNLNLLRRINRELGGDFNPSTFRHFAAFAPKRRAMESYLVSIRSQAVCVGDSRYRLEPWEPIHTETSRKYSEADIQRFARAAGFLQVELLHDERRLFVDALWRVGP